MKKLMSLIAVIMISFVSPMLLTASTAQAAAEPQFVNLADGEVATSNPQSDAPTAEDVKEVRKMAMANFYKKTFMFVGIAVVVIGIVVFVVYKIKNR